MYMRGTSCCKAPFSLSQPLLWVIESHPWALFTFLFSIYCSALLEELYNHLGNFSIIEKWILRLREGAHYSFLKILFIFKERRREKERETSMCGFLLCAPFWGPGLQPRHQTRDPLVWRLALDSLSHTSQGRSPLQERERDSCHQSEHIFPSSPIVTLNSSRFSYFPVRCWHPFFS